MNKAFHFSGLGVNLVTPFNANGEIDFPALERLVLKIQASPIEFIVVNGSASEAALMSTEECLRSLEFISEINNNEKQLIGGLPGGNTRLSVSQIASFSEQTPCSAIICHEPLPQARTVSGYLGHFRSLAQASALPIIIEHNHETVRDVSSALLQLAKDPNVCGIVDATGDVELNGKLIRNTPDNVFILTSCDGMILPLMALGIDGAVSTIANAFPVECSEMMGQMTFGNFQDAQKTHHALAPLCRILEIEGEAPGIKAILNHFDWMEDLVRLPNTPVSSETRTAIYKELAELPHRMVKHAML
ncbi:MAG TPA: hypothetical protein DD635_06990 [Flavobacteriales bacterium]|nr:hypothetical protein [Flavobacteriales bacterium]|tara:strand:+ start:6861 stop:7769 length:909 start_codon:yes stop_codon:yes gene_type:complete